MSRSGKSRFHRLDDGAAFTLRTRYQDFHDEELARCNALLATNRREAGMRKKVQRRQHFRSPAGSTRQLLQATEQTCLVPFHGDYDGFF